MGRDLTKCHPHLQKLAKELVTVCEKQGCPIGIGECFRTVQEQNRLYDQGRTKPGPVVTNAPGSTYRSMHLAIFRGCQPQPALRLYKTVMKKSSTFLKKIKKFRKEEK